MTWRPRTLTVQQLEERRLEGARPLIDGKLSQAQIARHLGVTPSAVARWKQRLDAADHRIEVLARRTAPGNPPSLTAEQWQQILAII